MRPRLLDLYSGAGGAAAGYMAAGFHVTGIDIVTQPRYCGDAFVQADALEYLAAHGHEYAAIHASPPCQGYSRTRHLPWLKDIPRPLLIEPTRVLLQQTGKPWVIENVEDAPLQGITLCGVMFGLKLYRHRRFESNYLLLQPWHLRHEHVIGGGRMFNDRQKPSDDGWVSLLSKGGEAAKRAMGIDWMTMDELTEAIPPVYAAYIGRQLLAALDAPAVAV